MFRPARRLFAALAMILMFGCGPRVEAQASEASLADASREIAGLVKTKRLSELRTWITNERVTYDGQGRMDPGIQCFLVGGSACPSQSGAVLQILSAPTFTYFHHLDGDAVVVAFVKEDARAQFNENPGDFLSDHYLKDYVACLLVRVEGGWRLQESIFFAETEGPFSAEPDV